MNEHAIQVHHHGGEGRGHGAHLLASQEMSELGSLVEKLLPQGLYYGERSNSLYYSCSCSGGNPRTLHLLLAAVHRDAQQGHAPRPGAAGARRRRHRRLGRQGHHLLHAAQGPAAQEGESVPRSPEKSAADNRPSKQGSLCRIGARGGGRVRRGRRAARQALSAAAAAGQGGFKLSLRGFDDEGDWISVTRSANAMGRGTDLVR